MYGQYAQNEPEEDSQTASETFSLAHLMESTRHQKRRGRGRGRGGSSEFLPVRMGGMSSGKKSSFAPRRAADGESKHGVSDFNSKLAAISEDDKGRPKEDERDVSLSTVMGGLDLNSGSRPPGKISPDSGSFTMTDSASELRETGTDFTDSLPRVGANLQPHVRSKALRPGELGFGPVRFPLTKSGLTDPSHGAKHELVERESAHNSYRTPHGKENHPTDIKGRLQALTGGKSQKAAVYQQHQPPRQSSFDHLAVTPAAACLQTPVLTPHRHRAPTAPAPTPTAPSAPHAPAPHIGTPMPGAGAAPNVMPPPSNTKSKEQILIVNGKRYRVMKLLGKGGSSRVYEAFDEEKNTVVAIKRVDLSDVDEAQKAGFVNEINLLHQLQGEDRIIKLYDYEKVVEEELLYVVMEKGETDLAGLMKKYTIKKEITPAMIKHYWSEMLHAVAVIHKRGVIHKDLKPANFMLVAGTLKLIDFGIASSIQSDKTSITIDNQQGTFNYMSPESIQDLNGPQFDQTGKRKPCVKISFKTDVWSLGCILYQLTYGKLPFADIKYPLMKLQAITNTEHHIPFPDLSNLDPRLIVVIKSCLERDVKSRASVEELLGHSFLKEEAVASSVATNPAVSTIKMLEALEGVLSPNTYKKTKEGFRLVGQLEK